MFFRCLFQLLRTMLQWTFAKKINHTATGTLNPIDRSMPVNKAEHFHFMEQIATAAQSQIIFTASTHRPTHAPKQPLPGLLLNPPTANGQSLVFSWGTKDTPLVCSPSRSVVSMISILTPCFPILRFYFYCLAKKSISSSPFIRQSFL